jgi:hypothetical protein
LLAQFDAGVKPEPEPVNNVPAESELDQLLADSNAETERNAMRSELDALKRAEAERLERAEFEDFANNLQKRLPEWAEPDRAVRELSYYAHRDDVRAAWETRGVSAAERRRAPAQLAQLQQLYQQVLASPDDPRKQAALQRIVAHGQWLEKVVLGNPNVLRRMEDDIHRRAWEPPINREATELKADIAWQMKSATGKRRGPEPPTSYGTMSNNEFRQKIRDEHGFDPIT